MTVIPRPRFIKRYRKLSRELQDKLWERIDLLQTDPSNPLLRSHGLRGDFEGARSINITGDWRLIYHQPDPDTLVLINLGTHSELYGK